MGVVAQVLAVVEGLALIVVGIITAFFFRSPRLFTFLYIQPDRGNEPIELAPEPSWGRVAYMPRAL